MRPDLRGYRTFQALVLGSLGVFLLARIADGGILRYINQRFLWLVLGAALFFLLLAQVLLQARARLPIGGKPGSETGSAPTDSQEVRPVSDGQMVGLWLLALPLLVGLLLPQRALGASAAALRGLGTAGAPPVSGSSVLALRPEQRDVLEWIRALETAPDPLALDGQPADVIGFVYRDAATPAGRFYVARFSITCCAADASAFGLEVDGPGDAQPAQNTWVRVRGRVAVTGADRPRLLLRASGVETVPEPVQPYLFP